MHWQEKASQHLQPASARAAAPAPNPRQFLAVQSLATTATISLLMAAAGRRLNLIYFYKHPWWVLITNTSNNQPNN
jgi:hypothetical protein